LVKIALAETSSGGDCCSPLFGGEMKDQNQGNTWKFFLRLFNFNQKLSFCFFEDMREYLPNALVTSPSHEAQSPG
jgi:hypothetical protein